MILDSFWIVSAAALLGVVLTLLYGTGRRGGLRIAGPLHGLIGASGLALLVLALRGPTRGAAYGVNGFGTTAAVLLGCAVPLGLLVLRSRLRRRDPMFVIGVHATVAIFGLVLLAAYVSVPA